MAFLNRNVNFVFLFLIVLVIIGFAGTTVYFQNSLQELTDEYNAKIKEASSLVAALKTEQNKSAEIYHAFLSCSNQSEEEQEDFNVVVGDLTNEKAKLNKTLLNTQSQLSSTLLTLSNKEKELSDTKIELSNIQSELYSVQADKEALDDTVEDYVYWVNRLSSDLNSLGEGIEYNCNTTTMQNLFDDVENDAEELDDLE